MADRDTPPNVDAYIAAQSDSVRPRLEQVRQLIKRAAPIAEESISYGMPTYKVNGARLVYFAAWKQHVGIYALPGSVLDRFKAEVSPYRQPKGTLHFAYNHELPAALLEALVRANLEQIQSR